VIEAASAREQSLRERPSEPPELRAKVKRMLDLVDDARGDVGKALEAQRRATGPETGELP